MRFQQWMRSPWGWVSSNSNARLSGGLIQWMQKMGGDRRGGIRVSQTVEKFPSAEIICMAGSCSHSVVFFLLQNSEALRWIVHQWIQQDERKRSGSEIYPKSNGPQAQVRAPLFWASWWVNLPEGSAASQLWWLPSFIITALIILYLKQQFRPGQNRSAGEGERKQQWGPLLYVAVPELSEQQVRVLCQKLCSQGWFAELKKQMFWSDCKVAGRCVQSQLIFVSAFMVISISTCWACLALCCALSEVTLTLRFTGKMCHIKASNEKIIKPREMS